MNDSKTKPYTYCLGAVNAAGLRQQLTNVMIACVCRTALDASTTAKEVDPGCISFGSLLMTFESFCRTVADIWTDCEDKTCICFIADWAVSYLDKEGELPCDWPELRRWAEKEGLI